MVGYATPVLLGACVANGGLACVATPARCREPGLRSLRTAVDGRGEHLPAALVPPELHERVHGPHPRRVPKARASITRFLTDKFVAGF